MDIIDARDEQTVQLRNCSHGDVVDIEGDICLIFVPRDKEQYHLMALRLNGEVNGEIINISVNSYKKATKLKAQLKIEHWEK